MISGRRRSADAPDETGSAEVEGCRIEWRAWGRSHLPGLVLVHGARAHAGWWSGVLTPALRRGRRIVALDLSGHGDSGRRATYTPRLWGAEVAAVTRACTIGRATLVGHSMGGWVTIVCAGAHPDLVGGVILVDCSIRRPEPGSGSARRGMPKRPVRLYATREEALASFRLMPEQPTLDEAAVRSIAERSLRKEGQMWRWKFDTSVAQRFSDGLIRDHLGQVRCPLHLVYGSRDPLVSPRTAADIAAMTGSPVPTTVIPGAYHHPILDHPTEVATALIESGLSSPGRG